MNNKKILIVPSTIRNHAQLFISITLVLDVYLSNYNLQAIFQISFWQ